ncbi:MAG TPA: DUF6519 domain-containing protein [Longimicrobium sp.]|jgi:hypothetical protein|nr:DUF6519 domain-containing protein [Longimicrobium sp.]
MSFDCSRFRFAPERDYLGVVMQQGRVQLDSDWNEQGEQLARRLQAGTLDAVGRAGVPRQTPDGFRITAAGGGLRIGPGRIYVDGLLAENHGGGNPEWDAALAELRGAGPVDYARQPYYPVPRALPAGGPHLVYLDVWRREVTHLQDPSLVEPAVGVDTTGRMQTVWQVKVLPDVGAVECRSGQVPGWADLTRPSAGRLTTGTAQVPGDPDPCHVPPDGGYLGRENQLYRVEVHDPGAPGAATFKWSRDNATVATAVLAVAGAQDRLEVASVGRDDVLRFNDGDWVEVTDDRRELHGRPGELRRIRTGGGVDDATRTLTLDQPLPPDLLPGNGPGDTAADRHTRVRRWDQAGRVRHPDATVYQDLDQAASTGAITVPSANTTVLVLEQGIVVKFSVDPAGGGFRSGDYWTFAARTADASVEVLDREPPRGIHHHYARLALVTFPGTATDCRTLWPPETGGGCCVLNLRPGDWRAQLEPYLVPTCEGGGDPEGDAGDTAEVRAKTLEVCFCAGTFRMDGPLCFRDYGVVRVTGRGEATRLVAAGETALCFDRCGSVTVRDLYAESGKEQRTHLGGTLTFLRCGSVDVRSVAARCAGGVRRAATCITVRSGVRRRARVRIRECRAEIGAGQTGFLLVNPERVMVNDNVLAAWGVRNLSLERRWRAELYRAVAMGMLETAYELRAAEREAERPRAPLRRVSGRKVRTPITDAAAAVARLDFRRFAETRSYPPLTISAADLPAIVRRWHPASVVPESPAALPESFHGFLQEIETVASQGIVVAGVRAVDVTIAGNAVHGALQGIHVGTSDPRTKEKDRAGGVTITGNRVTTSLPGQVRGDVHGIFVGNCDSLRIEGNRVSVSQLPRRQWQAFEGIRADGYFGPMVIVRNNHMEGCTTGVRFYPIEFENDRDSPDYNLWNVAYNMARGAKVAFDVPAERRKSVIAEWNLAQRIP